MKEFLKGIAGFILLLVNIAFTFLIFPVLIALTYKNYFLTELFNKSLNESSSVIVALKSAFGSGTNDYSTVSIIFVFIIFFFIWRIVWVSVEHLVNESSDSLWNNLMPTLFWFGFILASFFVYDYFVDNSQESAKFTDGRELKIKNGTLELWIDGKYNHKVYNHIRYLSEEKDFILENAIKVQTLGKNYAVLTLQGVLFSKGRSEGIMIHRIVMYDIIDEQIVDEFAIGTKRTQRILDKKSLQKTRMT
jgi:hypothetical protein